MLKPRKQNALCASYPRQTYAINTETECLKCFLSEPEEYHNHGSGMPNMLPYRNCILPNSRNWNAYCASYPRLKYAIITGTECQMCFRSETKVCHTQRIRMPTALLFVTEICHDHGNGMPRVLPIRE